MILISEHAYDRAKERLSLKKEALERAALKAFVEGITHSQTNGKLSRYITKLWSEHKTANNIRVYGEVLYLFCGSTLVTVYQLPNELRKIAIKRQS